ncbi:MAG: vacuolar ATPase assembly integral membrane protein vma21 [Lichina confinis]|nr:MAG: vacuolar ATPase assembly integral membrane protein vma21 [Lichina confinis]
MATRRNVALSEKEPWTDHADSKAALPGTQPVLFPAGSKSDITPAVPTAVIVKLLFFTAAMIAGPIGVYYLTVSSVFKGNSTFAGALAAITANVVLIAYVIVAMREDQSERLEQERQQQQRDRRQNQTPSMPTKQESKKGQ